jgi:uncharacterized membrane protein
MESRTPIHGMESAAKLAGHAIHPILIVFPLGLLAMAVVFDVLYFWRGNAALATGAFLNISAGILTGLLAAVFGLWDWLHIPSGTRAKTIGVGHALTNVVVLALFAVSWYLRWLDPQQLPSTAAFVVALVAAGLALVGGWLGGELVERLGVGVDPGAHLDAPSSISGKPAHERARS